MPTTQIEWPILQHFFCAVENTTGMPPQPLDATAQQLANAQKKQDEEDNRPKQLPKGVVLGPDGKPYVFDLIYQKCNFLLSIDVAPAPPSPLGQR